MKKIMGVQRAWSSETIGKFFFCADVEINKQSKFSHELFPYWYVSIKFHCKPLEFNHEVKS